MRQKVARRFNVTIHERMIGAWLRQFRLTRLQPRPNHPKQDAAAEVAYQKNPASPVKTAVPGSATGTPIEIRFQDG